MADEVQDRPIRQLMELGKPPDLPRQAWPDYLSMGIGPDLIPDLLALATNYELINNPDEDYAPGWAPVHAWRALGQLHCEAAIVPLLGLFHGIRDNDWVIEEMPGVFAQIGPAAFDPLVEYLRCEGYPTYARLIAATGLKQMALVHPQMRQPAVDALAEQLRGYRDNTASVNGVLIAQMVDLVAYEQAELIQRAFAEGPVDRFIAGDWRDVKKKLRAGAQAAQEQPAKRGGDMEPSTPPGA